MRDHDTLKTGVVEIFCVAAFDIASAVTPFSIHRENKPSGRRVRFGAIFWNRIRREGGSGDECSCLFYELASIHFFTLFRSSRLHA